MFDVAIIGAGFAGLAAGAKLAGAVPALPIVSVQVHEPPFTTAAAEVALVTVRSGQSRVALATLEKSE